MSNIFRCARCKKIFKEVEGDVVEASIQASKDFDLSPDALQKSGGLHKVCIKCYNEVMNQGVNTPKQTNKSPNLKIVDAPFTADNLHNKDKKEKR